MSNSKLENIILQTIDLITTKKINSAGFNKTIQAKIIKCEDASIGKYKVQYQDSIFYAYTENTSISYFNGSKVYVLLPNGDTSQQKIILGGVSTLGVDFANVTDPKTWYDIIGTNIIKNSNDISQQLCSYETKAIVLYQEGYANNNIIDLENEIVKEYFQLADHLILSMDVQTKLPEEQCYQGNYGLLLSLRFADNVIQNYKLDVDQMTGDPYRFVAKIQQQGFFDVDMENFEAIDKIALFVKDFPNQQDGKENDIFISNITLSAAKQLSNDQLVGYNLILKTIQGYIFTQNNVDTDKLSIQAELRLNNRPLGSTDGVTYYWFIENASITANNAYYHKYGGQGWKCLNQYTVIKQAQVENGIEMAPAVYKFLPSTKILNVQKSQILNYSTRYKCVVVYDDNVLNKEITILNLDASYKLELLSDTGTIFHMNRGEPVLTCSCKRKGSGGAYIQLDPNLFTFFWSATNNIGNYSNIENEILTEDNNNYLIDNNKLTVKISSINKFSFFKCSVNLKSTGTYIGTASITLVNSLEAETNGYSLVINNINQAFKYSVTGISPASKRWENPLEIAALTFTVYDEGGEPLSENVVSNCDITWKVPLSNCTLIKPNLRYVFEETDTHRIYKDLLSFAFEIQDEYDFNKNQNQIELEVIYNNIKLLAKTNLLFIKQGQSGTNGTDYACKIVPNTFDELNIPIYPTLYYYEGAHDDVRFNWDNKGVSTGQWFNVQFWHNGTLIYSGNRTGTSNENNKQVKIQKWEILKNNYQQSLISISDTSLLNVAEEQENNIKYWRFSLNKNLVNDTNYSSWRFANIVKVTLKYENLLYSATLPLIFCKIENQQTQYKVRLKDFTGFNRVLYTSAGVKPSYRKNSPFVIQVFNGQNEITDDLNYDWFYVGSVYVRQNNDNWTEQYQLTIENQSSNKWLSYYQMRNSEGEIIELPKNFRYVIPINNYNGQCVTIGMACHVYSSDNILQSFIFIPIHMSLNKSENSAINSWDGNSVSLGQNGGMILAPQVGAGIKEEDNSFTGLFIGTAKDPEQNISENIQIFNSFNNLSEDVGLFGYSKGHRSIFLDAKTGKASFGVKDSSQIIMDPSNNTAIIQSGDFQLKDQTHDGSGMQINLTNPSITFGNQNFSVNANGILTARGANIVNSYYDGKQFDEYLNQAITKITDNLQKQIDGQIVTWYGNEPPTVHNYPYINWIDIEGEVPKHQGDVYYDKTNKLAYRFINNGTSDNPVWAWELIEDDLIAEAISKSTDAETLARGKRRIFTQQPTLLDAYDKNDLWVNATWQKTGVLQEGEDPYLYKDEILVCITPKAKNEAFSINHWRKAALGYLDNRTYQPRKLMEKLTQNNRDNGIWMSPDTTDNKLYINATNIKAEFLTVQGQYEEQPIFQIDSQNKTVTIIADSFSLKGTGSITDYVDQQAKAQAQESERALRDEIRRLSAGSDNLLTGTNKVSTLTTEGSWQNKTWKRGSQGQGTITFSGLSETTAPNNIIKKSWIINNQTTKQETDIAQDNVPVQPGNSYVLSCYVKGDRGSILAFRYGVTEYVTQENELIANVSKWQKITWIIDSLSNQNIYVEDGKTNIYFGNHGIGSLQICGMKLERGNLSSDWSPSIYDLDEATQQSINIFNESLKYQKMYNKLTNNGDVKGIELQNDPLRPGKKALIINANYIRTGVMSANLLKTGIIKSQKPIKVGKENKYSTWNLDKGIMELYLKNLYIDTGNNNYMSLTSDAFRTRAKRLSWQSQFSTLDPDGKLVIGSLTIGQGVLKNGKRTKTIKGTTKYIEFTEGQYNAYWGGIRTLTMESAYDSKKGTDCKGFHILIPNSGKFFSISREENGKQVFKLRYTNKNLGSDQPINTWILGCDLNVRNNFVRDAKLVNPSFIFGKNKGISTTIKCDLPTQIQKKGGVVKKFINGCKLVFKNGILIKCNA